MVRPCSRSLVFSARLSSSTRCPFTATAPLRRNSRASRFEAASEVITHYRLGRVELAEGNLEPAISSLKRAADLDPEVPMFFETLADAYIKADRTSLAIDMLERASTLEPDRADLYIRLGDLYKEEGDYNKAVNRYWEAIDIKDDEPHVHRNLQDIFEFLAKHEKERLNKMEQESAIAQSGDRP